MNFLAQTTQPVPAVFKLSVIFIAIFGTVGTAVVNDLQGYSAARKEWDAGGRKDTAPLFDWALFGTRIVTGVLTGVATALGIGLVSQT